MPPTFQVDLWPFDLESGVRVACDAAYLYTNFGLPMPVCSRLGPMYATDRQTSDVRHASSLNAPTLGARNNNLNRAVRVIWSRNHPAVHVSRQRIMPSIPRCAVPKIVCLPSFKTTQISNNLLVDWQSIVLQWTYVTMIHVIRYMDYEVKA